MLNKKKAPGLDLITARMLKELPKEGPLNLMYIFSTILRLRHWPKSLKIAQIIMIPKAGKSPKDVSSYRQVSLLTGNFKITRKLVLKNSIKT
jgi:hypothetical protein